MSEKSIMIIVEAIVLAFVIFIFRQIKLEEEATVKSVILIGVGMFSFAVFVFILMVMLGVWR